MTRAPEHVEDAEALTVPVELDTVRLLWMLGGALDDDAQLLRRGAAESRQGNGDARLGFRPQTVPKEEVLPRVGTACRSGENVLLEALGVGELVRVRGWRGNEQSRVHEEAIADGKQISMVSRERRSNLGRHETNCRAALDRMPGDGRAAEAQLDSSGSEEISDGIGVHPETDGDRFGADFNDARLVYQKNERRRRLIALSAERLGLQCRQRAQLPVDLDAIRQPALAHAGL